MSTMIVVSLINFVLRILLFNNKFLSEIKPCKDNMRQCPKGWCINKNMFCDGHEDCEDGFDEIGCAGSFDNDTCDLNQYACPSNLTICVDSHDICNDRPDCPNGEDEKHCPTCPSHMFECANDRCIVGTWICDGTDDCGDGSDEMNCNKGHGLITPSDCEAHEFKCTDGKCLDYSMVCNNKTDCSGGDDEGARCETSCNPDPCRNANCQRTPKGAKCSCNEGYQLSSAGDKTCVDIDECKAWNPCAQECTNKVGSFRCSCSADFVLGGDKRSCVSLGLSHNVLYSINDQIRNITGSSLLVDVLVKTEDVPIVDFDVNVEKKVIQFVLSGYDELFEMNFETKQNRSFTIPTANRIAHDWITGNTYIVHYPDDNRVEIYVCHAKTKACGIIRKLGYHQQIPSLQVDPINKLLFSVELTNSVFIHPTSSVVKMRLDGSDPKAIFNETHITAVALDIDQRKVYVTEIASQSLQTFDYNGDDRRYIAKQTRFLKRPIAMALFENHAYILNNANSQMTLCKLYGKMECVQVEIMGNNARRISIVQEHHQRRGKNLCEENTCDAICIPTDLGHKCLCTNGTFIAPDMRCNQTVSGLKQFYLILM